MKICLSEEDKKQKALWVRQTVAKMISRAGLGHIAPAYSCAEILVDLYYGGHVEFNPDNPNDPTRDYVILSKGQACAALYAVLADVGFFPVEDLMTHCQAGTYLGGHSETNVPGVEAYTGSLGHGLSIAAGIAYGLKIAGKKNHVWCILGDGELQEGSNWEAFDFAYSYSLGNLTAIVDYNHQQAIDFTEDAISGLYIQDKIVASGWNTRKVDGHKFPIIELSNGVYENKEYPEAIIAETVKGKGVPEIEKVLVWHYRAPKTDEELGWFCTALGLKPEELIPAACVQPIHKGEETNSEPE